ncbi:MFS transporter [Streptosporangium sp. G11]|uniref:MFS transporter n=1 Tax=Streptosporangium sp. G11 TaxID=3436926 RepID=UPI003EBF05ED
MSRRTRPGGGPRGFWIVTAVLGFSLAAAGAPTPLYGVYAARWGFSAITLSVVFAVYAVALLGALLAFGALSDAVGRKPVVILALSLQVIGLLCFVAATDAGWLLAARVAQGAATGLVSAAASAALLDLQPPGRPGLGAFMNALMSSAGLCAGALGSGALVQYAPHPERLVYVVLLVMAVLLLAGVLLLVDETVTDRKRPRLWSRIAVPKPIRPAFLTAVPCLAATLALGGLYLSLGPSLAGDLNHSHNHLLGGGVPAMLCGTGALATAALRLRAPRVCMIAGCVTLTSGSALTTIALVVESPGLFYASTVVAGVGFGAGCLGSLRSLVSLADPEQRGALVSAIYIVVYTAFSVPIVVAGVIATHIGLHATAIGFCAVLAVLALTALIATLRTSAPAEPTPAPALPAGLDAPRSS